MIQEVSLIFLYAYMMLYPTMNDMIVDLSQSRVKVKSSSRVKLFYIPT